VALSQQIRAASGVPTAAVGLITSAQQADAILRAGSADMVFLARKLLRDPYWPLQAARELDVELEWPLQYQRAVD
jgi:2,4-dienoyl-CoA reductase-like NADH-dependent reductase (Old Yellow Enzyme family)